MDMSKFFQTHHKRKKLVYVNKVETGVRLTHLPTEERTQQANRKIAVKKLQAILKDKSKESEKKFQKNSWRKHYQLERGNPVKIYEGLSFNLKN